MNRNETRTLYCQNRGCVNAAGVSVRPGEDRDACPLCGAELDTERPPEEDEP